MKKILVLALVVVIAAFGLAGCGSKADEPASAPAGDLVTLTVGATASPHAEILNALKDTLAAEGVDLQVIEYTDYVIPNTATDSGEIDCNYFQHQPYLDDFNAENGTALSTVVAVHYEPMGIYPGKTATLDAIADGAVIAIPNDTTNEARALQLLAQEGLITLPENAGLEITPIDIVENPHNIQFTEVEAAAVPAALGDSDFAVVNGNYALAAGLTADQGLAYESAESVGAQTYANILVCKTGNENNEAIQKLAAALTSEECRAFIEKTYSGMVLPVF